MSALNTINTDADEVATNIQGESGNMSRTFLDQLGWMEQSPNLKSTLRRSFVYASEQSHREVTLEHTLLALTEDAEAAEVLRACNVDIDGLRNAVAGFIGQHNDRLPPNEISPPAPSADLLSIMNHASAATKDGQREHMDGAIVLAAMISEGRSPAAELLRQNGLAIDLPGAAAAPPQGSDTQVERAVPEPTDFDAPIEQNADNGETDADRSIDEMLAEVRSKIHEQEGVTDPILTDTPVPPVTPVQPPAPAASTSPANARAAAPGGPPTGYGTPNTGHQQSQPGGEHAQFAVRPSVPPGAPTPVEPHPYQRRLHAPAPTTNANHVSRPQGQPQPQGQTMPNGNMHPGGNGQARQQPAPASHRPNGQQPHPIPPQQSRGLPNGAHPVANGGPQPQTTRPVVPPRGAPPQPVASPGEVPAKPSQRESEPDFKQVELKELPGSILLEAIPRKLGRNQTERAQLSVRRKDIEALANAFNMEEVRNRNGSELVQALTVRLRAPGNGLGIEPESPETQWVHSGSGLFTDDEVSWRWAITGKQVGKVPLKIEVATRTVTDEGRLFEAILPQQSVEVAVTRSIFGLGLKVLYACLALGAAFAIGLLSPQMMDMATSAIGTLSR